MRGNKKEKGNKRDRITIEWFINKFNPSAEYNKTPGCRPNIVSYKRLSPQRPDDKDLRKK